MATRTLTATPYANDIQRKGININSQSWQVQSGATKFGTIGDSILIAKIPHGTVLTDFKLRLGSPSTLVQGVLVVTVGTTVTTMVEQVSQSQTLTAVAAGLSFSMGGKPLRISCSDNAAIQYGILQFNVTAGTESTTFCCAGSIVYTSNESSQ